MIVENLEDEAIVISGVSGKFPNSNNVDKLIENLLNSVDCISENHTRWPKVPRRIGSMPEITKLGNIFFGVSTKTEKTMDPVSKLLLPSAVEAISDAGLNFSEIRRTNIGVFGALSYQESDENTIYQKAETCGFEILGYARYQIEYPLLLMHWVPAVLSNQNASEVQ